MFRILKCLFFSMTASILWSGDQEWHFVWVSYGPGRYDVVKGQARVTLSNGRLVAEIKGDDGIEFKVVGKIVKRRVTAKFSVIGSDYLIDSPFSGTYTSKHGSAEQGFSGCESISLTDGWNFLGFSRELP